MVPALACCSVEQGCHVGQEQEGLGRRRGTLFRSLSSRLGGCTLTLTLCPPSAGRSRFRCRRRQRPLRGHPPAPRPRHPPDHAPGSSCLASRAPAGPDKRADPARGHSLVQEDLVKDAVGQVRAFPAPALEAFKTLSMPASLQREVRDPPSLRSVRAQAQSAHNSRIAARLDLEAGDGRAGRDAQDGTDAGRGQEAAEPGSAVLPQCALPILSLAFRAS